MIVRTSRRARARPPVNGARARRVVEMGFPDKHLIKLVTLTDGECVFFGDELLSGRFKNFTSVRRKDLVFLGT